MRWSWWSWSWYRVDEMDVMNGWRSLALEKKKEEEEEEGEGDIAHA